MLQRGGGALIMARQGCHRQTWCHTNVIPIVKQSEVIKKDLFLQTRLIVLY